MVAGSAEDAWVGTGDDSAVFEEWLDRLVGATSGYDGDDEIAGDPVDGAELRWFRHLYDTQGPIEPDDAWNAFYTEQLALARQAVTAVEVDLHRTTSRRPRVVV